MTADTTRPIAWGIVGVGSISRSMVQDMKLCAEAAVVSVFSRDAGKTAAFAREHDIPSWTDDFTVLLADERIDAVYIGTPFAFHYEQVEAAILAGKHVLVEKPITLTAAKARELFVLAHAHGVFLMEGMWMKFNPAFARLHEELAAGRIGPARNARAGFSMPFPQDGGSRWDLARSGSTLLDQGIYPVTFGHSIFGPPASVYARGRLREDGLDLAVHFTLEYDDGRFMTGVCGTGEFTDCSAAVAGSDGWITVPQMFWAADSIEIHAGDWGRIIRNPERLQYPRQGNGYVPMLNSVTAAVQEGLLEHPVHDAEATVAVFDTLDRIRAAIA